MKLIIIIALVLVIFAAGCLEDRDSETKSGKIAEKMTVTIKSPKIGDILQGEKDVNFESSISGGVTPFSYRWSSNIDGEISTSSQFRQKPSRLSKGSHVIILQVTDASGNSAQGSTQIEVM